MDTKKRYDKSFIFLIAILGLLLISRLFFDGFVFGYRTAFVLSESMEPEIPVASFLIEKNFSEGKHTELNAGDIITFKISDGKRSMRVTHRIIKIQDDRIYTKGDNNHAEDPWTVTKDQVESRVVFVFSLW